MSEQTPQLDFERSWQNKLATGLDQLVEPPEREWILSGGETLTMDSPTIDKIVWTCEMMERLDDRIDPEMAKQVFADCHCSYPVKDLLEAKMTYRLYGDVDQVLSLLQAKFEGFLRDVLDLDEELVREIISRGWGLAGVRDGERIIATKIPKSSYLVDYFQSDDPYKKRKLYCHCPRVRDHVGDDPQLMEEYCYCGAGFYKGIWETILGEPVRVEVLESVMHGGEVCKIAVHLPDSITLINNE